MSLTIDVLPVGLLQANCYVVKDNRRSACLIIDPGAEAPRILSAVAGFKVEAIILTHAHYDHIGALDAVREATGAPAYLHEAERDWPQDPYWNGSAGPAGLGIPLRANPPDELLRGGENLPFGDVTFKVLHTPGHSPGGISLLTEGVVFSGDALFRGGIGRTDLPGGNLDQLLTSLHEQLLALPDDTWVFPGHGPATTIGAERGFIPHPGLRR